MKLKDRKIPCILFLPLVFPYLILFALICIFTDIFMETVFQNNGFYLVLFLIIIYIFALASSIVFFAKSFFLKITSLELLRINMTIKLIQIPAYVLIFIFGLLCLITIFTTGISIILMIFDSMAIFLTGLIGLSGVIKCLIENKITKKTAVIYGIFQFVFCVDIITSIKIYKKTKIVNNSTTVYN